MEKEILSLGGIKQDFLRIVKKKFDSQTEWASPYIVLATVLALCFGLFSNYVWIGVVFLLPVVFHAVQFFIKWREYRIKKKAIASIASRADISVSIVKFSHIAKEQIYEPHASRSLRRGTVHVHLAKTVSFYYFTSGFRWRIPTVAKHYRWSKSFPFTTKGLENISIEGDEFYLIALQSDYDLSYIYPCKYFVLDESLQEKA